MEALNSWDVDEVESESSPEKDIRAGANGPRYVIVY